MIDSTELLNWSLRYLHNVWGVLLELSPWLILGCLVAGLLHVLIPQGAIKRHLGQPGFGAIVKAALAGVPMPLCSCGVIPAGIGLRKDGASRGASVSFLVATPQTAVDSTFVSYSFLGWPFAIFKLLSSFLTGLIAGVLAQRFGGPEEDTALDDERLTQRVHPTIPSPYPTVIDKIKGVWRYGIEDLLYMIWGWVTLGVLVSAALTTFIPANFFGDAPFASGFTGLLIALAISLPMYACSTASVPIAAGLVHAGLPPGAALVYLVAGPATNVATIGAIYRVFGGRVITIYLGVIIVSSLLFGHLFGFLVDMTALRIHDHGGHEHVNSWAAAAAIFLLIFIARFAWRDGLGWIRSRRGTTVDSDALEHMTFPVGGMTCKGCANKVRVALLALPEVLHVDVDIDPGQAIIRGRALRREAIAQAIRDAGYQPG